MYMNVDLYKDVYGNGQIIMGALSCYYIHSYFSHSMSLYVAGNYIVLDNCMHKGPIIEKIANKTS